MLTARDALTQMADQTISAEELAHLCFKRIDEREPLIRAWAWLERDRSIAYARGLDKGFAPGLLHGLPIGIKDMILTKDMPTQHNSPIYQGHRPGIDASFVDTLRAAGANIIGKTETVEFATGGRKALTRNPWDTSRTPGGTSSGSAAAVADGHVPVAFGTQTAGSIIRPASFCGVYALKPTWGSVSRDGVKTFAPSLDTVSWIARSAEDLAIFCDVFAFPEARRPAPETLAGQRIAICRTASWDKAEEGTRQAMAEAISRLQQQGAVLSDLELPDAFADLPAVHAVVADGEARMSFLNEYRANYHLLHEDLRRKVENAAGIGPHDLLAAYDRAAACRASFDRIAADYDAILTPSAVGEAPVGLHTTGDPAFNRMWSLLHMPCVNIPGLTGPSGLPVGLTLVAGRYEDRRLVALAGLVGQAFGGA